MTTTETPTPTPPECCPICGASAIRSYNGHHMREKEFQCGLIWKSFGEYLDWQGECKDATAAALRCHATLEPTPREQARDALVQACHALLDYRNHNALNFQLEKADDFLARIAAALATEPQP